MKSGLKAIIIILVIIGTTLTTSITPSSAFSVGDSFVYEITNAYLYVDIGENNYQIDGFLHGGDIHPKQTKVIATVDYIQGSSIKFNFTVNDRTSVAFISSNWLESFGVDFSYYTLYYTYLMVENWGNGFWLDLTLYQIKPFIGFSYYGYLNDLDKLGEDIDDFFNDWWYNHPGIECEYIFTESNGIYYFESWVGGKLENILFGNHITGGNNFLTDIKFGNNMHFSVNKTSGLVHGFGRRGWIKGEINNQQVKSSMSCEYALEGFDFPKYQLGNMKYFRDVNVLLVVVLPFGIVVILTPIIIYIINNRKFNKLPES